MRIEVNVEPVAFPAKPRQFLNEVEPTLNIDIFEAVAPAVLPNI
jgi:hypothetical protein